MLIEIRKNLQGNNSRMDEAENQINAMEHRKKKTTKHNNKMKKKYKNNEGSISSLWDNFKRSNIFLIGVREGEEKEPEIGNLFEKIMKENFLTLLKEIDMQVHET